ncbi:uncharacterized protein LOC128991482 [Macrosteles quadrilineatus]|uniref:uncharacterized protein LOC128991482 n=1 Tax=Macrosteles quadrilineatus TaxID=74068 RepID=UPI0023E0D750|nr:uncharacterized protein LOC128991482 [Macrosteles quadrilineatus]
MDESCDRILKVKKTCNISPGVVDLSVVEDENYIKGGILSNNTQCWVSCGPQITNINSNGSKRTGWTFGWATGDKTIRVVCVEELIGSSTSSPILVVGCESDNGGSLCFYHSGSSRILKVINFHDKITSVAVVSKSNESQDNLSDLLEPWNGVVAVGTNVGKVYLVDVWWKTLERCIGDFRHKVYDEQRPSKLVEVTITDLENDFDCRTSSIRHGSSTLALWLNEVTFERSRINAHPGLHNILGRMPLEFLSVSVLKYFPQISTLAVGYNTSCFQLWELSTLTLLYTSALLEAMLPVFSFSLLEPSDDPRYVCYLWSLHHSVDEDNIPFGGMYIISYHEKHLKPHSSQYFYEGFASCSIRYQLDLGADMTDVDIASGRIISCQSIHRSTSKSSSLWTNAESEESGGEESTASLLSIAWEVWSPNLLSVHRKLTLFDLNQWYREYMPTSSDMEYTQFMAHFCLPDGQLLDVKVIPSSVKQFQALQPLDEHFYPVATSFDCLVLHQSQVMVCSHVGVQQQALESLTAAGPSGLLLPACLYKQCTQAGLRPLLVDIGSPTKLQSSDQRAYLLCVALEHELTQYLRQCVAHWADGSHAVAGCTLPSLLGWAWDRVQRYKKWLDRLCVPLFDYSGTALDTNDLGIFHHMICQFHRLRDLFGLVLEKYSNCIIKGNFEQQYTVINLVSAFYDSIFWCIQNKVLPEVNANESSINGCIPYFTDKIINATITRRAELHQLAKALQDPSPAGLLLIDAVIAQEAGAKVTDQWEREGSSATLGKYPPASVQSLLRTYLIRNVSSDVKHFIVTYFLLDIAHVVCSLGASESIRHNLLKFPTDFGLTESQSKIVEAFWYLDHKQYKSGVDLLLDSCVYKEDLQVYQHRTVLCLLAAVGEYKLALHYFTTRRRTPTEPQDIRMEMTLLLVNDLIHEAFQFQRHHQSMSAELLDQFFKGCVKMNKLNVIFKLALTPSEEEAFMTFLQKTSHPKADDLRVFYLLSRSRYVEAIDVNEKLHSALGVRRGMGLSPAPAARKTFGTRGNSGGPTTKTVTTRDMIINSVTKGLPSITRDLADYCHREKHCSWTRINRPKPLSMDVTTELSKDRLPQYKTSESQLLKAAVLKTREIWAPLLATPAALKRKLQTVIEETPFLRNPIHSRLNCSVVNIEEVRSGVRSRTDDEDSIVPKRARLEFSPSGREITQTETNLDKTSDMDITCPVSSEVLHTPLVARIVKKTLKEIHTPQSILKGRSGPNTPLTPAKERLGSPAVGRQIRFSLPPEDSQSSIQSEEEMNSDEGECLKTTVSPRKSIHETSDLHNRLPTPSNPRLLQKLLSHSKRSSVTRLQFDEPEETHNEGRPELSSTAVALLKKISSSSQSTEEDYFSFQSSSPEVQSNKSANESKFKINYGLEGNIESQNYENVEQDQTYREDYDEEELDIYFGSDEIQKEANADLETTITDFEAESAERKSLGHQNQASESMHLTLEYKGDISSSVQIDSKHLRDTSSFVNIDSKHLRDTSSSVHIDSEHLPPPTHGDVTFELKEQHDIEENEIDETEMMRFRRHVEELVCSEQEIGTDPIEEKTEEKLVLNDTKQSLNERDSIVMDLGNKQVVEAEVLPESAQSSDAHIISDEVETNAETEIIDEPIPTQSLRGRRESVEQEINVSSATLNTTMNTKLVEQDTIEVVSEKKMEDLTLPVESVHKELIHNVSLSSQQDFVFTQKEKEICDLGNTEDITSRSVRGTTPLPQILEELVKKGRISLSVPESESIDESNLTPEQHSLTEAVTNTICNPLEEPVIEKDLRNEGIFDDKPQEEIEADCKSSQSDENINISEPEKEIVSKEEESFLSFPTKGSLKQMFVFGNEASLSTSAVNSNLTFTIGTNVFGSSTWEDPTCKTDSSDSSTKDEPEAKNEEEIPVEPQISSTSDNQNKSSNDPCQFNILETHSLTTEVFNDEPSSEKPSEDIQNADTSEISQRLPPDVADNDQILDFYIDTSSTKAVPAAELEADLAADFELKMSEGDVSVMEVSSCEKIDEETPEEAEKEPVFETLKPVEYQFDGEESVEEDNCYDQFTEKEDVDEDIYGDLEEVGDDGAGTTACQTVHQEVDHKEEKEVIFLGSSSDEEEPMKKFTKSSTPYRCQPTPKTVKQHSKLYNETLDYEVEEEVEEEEEEDDVDEEYEEDYSDQEQPNESYSSESSIDDHNEESENEMDSKIEKKNLYFSSESESDTSHNRRSWKQQRNQYGSNESLRKENITTDEDTVESPPFEIIGQDSQECHTENLKSVCEENKEESLKIEATVETPTLLEEHSTEAAEVIENNKLEPTLDSIHSITSKESDSHEGETPEVEMDIDIIKLAQENRQKRLETGSIPDLRNRRSRRYSSLTNLKESKRLKLRRKSCSQHDLESLIIQETKSTSWLSPEKEVSTANVSQISPTNTATTTNELQDDSVVKTMLPPLTTQPNIMSEIESCETNSVTSSLLPERGSIVSNQTFGHEFPKLPENFKRKSKPLVSRLSSLHDISEENSEISESVMCPPQDQDQSTRRSLRRSVSSDQLTAPTQTDVSQIRRSNSVCMWYEYAKAHQSEITSDDKITGDGSSLEDPGNKSVWPVGNQKKKYATRKSKKKESTHTSLDLLTEIDDEEKETVEGTKESTVQLEENKEALSGSVTSEGNVCSVEPNIGANEIADDAVQCSDNSRWLRAQSEPSSLVRPSTGRRSRRSSSSMKINEYHKKVLPRSSLKGKSFGPQEFEIIDSDVESPRITSTFQGKSPVQESISNTKDQSSTLESNFENVQVEVSKETIEPLVTIEPNMTLTPEHNERLKRGHSEPPASAINPPKTRSRARRSSFSYKIEKVHRMILPRHSRNSRSSLFQPMEIVQSDEENSFQKTPVRNEQEFESEHEVDHKINETPVTSKKQKTLPKNVSESNKIDPEKPQDYPQPPKKRGRSKNKPTEVEVSELGEKVINVNQTTENLPAQEVSDFPKSQAKKQNLKSKTKVGNDTETTSAVEHRNETSSENSNVGVTKTSIPKKRKNAGANKDPIDDVTKSTAEHKTDKTEKVKSKKKKISDEQETPKKTTKSKIKEIVTPSKEQSDSENAESSLTESQADEMKVSKPNKIHKVVDLSILDSPARRTRRSMSRMSETEITPTKDKLPKRTRRSSIKSDVVLSTPNKYAASEMSDASTELNLQLNTPSKPTPGRRSSRRAESEMSDASTELNVQISTPIRRSIRRPSISASTSTPELIPEELLMQRRLTRHQHAQLQKSFELSFAESPKLSRLEEVPEESVEDGDVKLTPIRSSKRTKASTSKGSKIKSSKK